MPKRLSEHRFGANDSKIASTIMHPVEALGLLSDWLTENANTAAGIPVASYDEADPYGYAPSAERRVAAALNLAGLAQMGAMPGAPSSAGGTLGTIVGRKSAGWDKVAAARAEKMLDAGIDPTTVWKQVGYGRLPSGQLFREISDEGLKINPSAKNIRSWANKFTEGLGPDSIIEHPELAAQYPELKKLAVAVSDTGAAQGSYTPGTNMIRLAKANPAKMREVAAHELEHSVSAQEGWPAGGSPSAIGYDDLPGYYKSRLDNVKSLRERAMFSGDADRAALADSEYRRMLADAQQGTYEQLAGEALANAAGSRVNMSASELANSYPMATGKLGGVKIGDLITRYNDPKVAAMQNLNVPDSTKAIQRMLIDYAAKDKPTTTHMARVAAITKRLIDYIKAPADEAATLRAAALGHDMGKRNISPEILHKVGRLTDDEFTLIKQHPADTLQILTEAGIDPTVAQIAGSHHMQQIPGKGYPAHEGLPIKGAENVQAADILDSLIGGAGSGHDQPTLWFRGSEVPRNTENILGIMDDMAAKNEIDPKIYKSLREMSLGGKLPKKIQNILEGDEMIGISRDEYQLWIDSATTKKILARIRDIRQQYCDALSTGSTLESSAEGTLANTARVVGTIAGLDYILNIEISEISDGS